MKKLLFISLVAILALSVGLVGCSSPTQYTLTVASGAGGSVFPAVGDHTYNSGQVVDIKATPASDAYQFVNWTGDTAGIADVSKATTKITMNGDYSIKANFESLPWDSTISLAMHCTISNRASIVEFIFDPWVAQLEALTGAQGGKFDVTVTYGDAPFDATTSLAAISSGVVDIGQLSGDTFHLGGIGVLPWLFPDMETAAFVTHNMWTEANQKWDNGELSGVKILISAPLWGAEWWGNVEVKVPADLEGVKVRAEGTEAAGLLALGASPVYLGTSEIGPALQTGIVEGCFFTWSGIGGFSGVGPNVDYVTQLDIFYRVYALAINKAIYDALPAEAQEAIDSLSTPAKSVALAAAHAAGAAEDKAATEAAKPVYVPTATEFAAWKAATASVATDWAEFMTSRGFDGAGILARVNTLISQAP